MSKIRGLFKIHIYIIRCRHALFSKYFGDAPPKCVNRCDVCKNKDAVREKVLKFESSYQYKSNKRPEYLDSFGLEKYENVYVIIYMN